MVRVLVVHREIAEAAGRAARLSAQGFEAFPYTSLGTKGFREIRAAPPDAIVIDLTRLPSYGKYFGALVREQKSLRRIPLVFIEGDPDKAKQVRAVLPDAVFAPWSKAAAAIHKAIERAPAEPLAPVAPNRPLLAKLGIGDGCGVALLHPPKDFRLPKGPWRPAAAAAADVVIVFCPSTGMLGRELPAIARMMRKGRKLWIAWPKKTGKASSLLTMPRVQEMIAAYGLTQYKICALDATWSAMELGLSRVHKKTALRVDPKRG